MSSSEWDSALAVPSEGDAETSSTQPRRGGGEITASDYIAKADRLCASARPKVRSELAPLVEQITRDGKTTQKEAMRLNKTAAAVVRPVLRRLEALPTPSGKREAIEAYLKANRETLEALDRAVTAYEAGDREAATSELQRNRELAFATANAAGSAGFKECGKEYQK